MCTLAACHESRKVPATRIEIVSGEAVRLATDERLSRFSARADSDIRISKRTENGHTAAYTTDRPTPESTLRLIVSSAECAQPDV
jgi:hypothetical protein